MRCERRGGYQDLSAYTVLHVQISEHGPHLTSDHSRGMVRELSQGRHHEVTAYDPDIRQPKSVTRPHRHVGQVLGQDLELQGCSLDGCIQLHRCVRRIRQIRRRIPHDAAYHSRNHLMGHRRRPQCVVAPPQESLASEYMFLLHGCHPLRIKAQAQVGYRAFGLQADSGGCRIVRVQAHHDRGDASGGGIRTLADVGGHAHVRQVLSDRRCTLHELRQGVRYQQEVVAIRLHQGRHNVAGIALGFACKASQEGLQEEEVEHGAFRTALPQAPAETNARRGAICGDNAHRGAAAEGMEELAEVFSDPPVAQEKCQRPMRGRVKNLGNIKGQDMILLLSTLQPALGQEHLGRHR